MKHLRNFVIRLAITYIVFTVLMALPGIQYQRGLFAIWKIALIFVVLTAAVRPVLLALTLPFTIMSAGLFIFVIDGLLLLVTERLSGLEIATFGWAILAAVLMSIVNTWVTSAFRRLGWYEPDEDGGGARVNRPGFPLRVLLLLGLLFGLLFNVDMTGQLALALSSLAASLPIIFGGAFAGMAALSFGMAWLVAEGLRLGRRIRFSTAVCLLATGLLAAVALPLLFTPLSVSPPSPPPTPAPGVGTWELRTGSHIAYTHFPAAGGTAASPFRPPIVFLHDGAGWATFNADREFYRQFAADGFDVYLYDQVGTGLSGRLARVKEYGIMRDIADLDAIRVTIGAREMFLIGQGAGGELAARYMSRHPERVAGVVFVSPTPMWDDDQFFYDYVPTGSALGPLPSVEARPLFAGLMVLYGPKAANKLVSQEEVSDWYTQNFAPQVLVCAANSGQAPRPETMFNYYVNQRVDWSANQPPDPRTDLADDVTPVILLVGECDYVPWEVILQYTAALLNHKVFYFPGAGHMIHLTRAQDMAGVIRAFLLDKPFPMEPYTSQNNPRPALPGTGL